MATQKKKNNNNKILLPFEKPLEALYDKLEELRAIQEEGKMPMTAETGLLEKRIEAARGKIFSNLNPTQIVQVARHLLRPTMLDYVNLICEDFVELHGDRNF
ncbi:MAG TPA: hypothetical protein VMT55_06390, partial [Candidatus Sulfotelmatobacter sp.]|nr:hypothetical protein [Candidatus Sulfotelmatobacter sp.]